MKIKIALSDDLKGYKKYEVVYILDGEIKETIKATIEDEHIVFEITHLSEYGIVATNPSAIENPKTGDNVSLYILTSIISILGLAGAGTYIYRRKQTN